MNTLIGIFDSGLGGLSVWSEVVRLMPKQPTIYYADAANCPYGGKTADEIYNLTEKGIKWLIGKGTGVIIIACNTATGAAIEKLRIKFPKTTFIGIEPAIKKAAESTESKVIGILATKFTLQSEKYLNTKRKYTKGVQVIEQSGEGLVELVESGKTESKDAEKLLKRYIDPMIESNADILVLGCTHYPFLKKKISEITDNKIKILDPAPYVVKHTMEIMTTKGLTFGDDNRYQFHSTLSASHSHYIRKRAFEIIENVK